MTEAGFAVERTLPLAARSRRSLARALPLAAFWAVVLGNAAAIVWLWWHGGNVTNVHSTGDLLTSIARITGLLGAYLALLQVVLLARLPWLERLVGFDRLTFWHRWNGHACLDLILLHVFFSIWGYAALDKVSIPKEIGTMLGGGIYPGMITATVGTALFIAVVVTSVVIARRRLRYEWWHAVHLSAYAAIALAWFHQIPTGNELVLDRTAADYWRAIYIATLALLVGFTTSSASTRAPASSSSGGSSRAAAGGPRIRSRSRARRTAARCGSRSRPSATSRVASATAGGIGITPIRALMEDMEPGAIVIYRVLRHEDVIFRNELEPLARERGIKLFLVAGDHATEEGALLLTPAHLQELVPDIRERDVYVCGPPAMTDVLEKNVRGTGVPRRFIHTERFAL